MGERTVIPTSQTKKLTSFPTVGSYGPKNLVRSVRTNRTNESSIGTMLPTKTNTYQQRGKSKSTALSAQRQIIDDSTDDVLSGSEFNRDTENNSPKTPWTTR
ncbi:hypothetical protein KY290_011020 [Solanum tuberosum]|uniref:Uncharacterized protein n=1 Tax=Solanum tuberosum TaxID=4113 RepID=A0ABQ7VZG6_SOLTU|nr:hypothetical protein KY290_011020 [Solanum tuberosum]